MNGLLIMYLLMIYKKFFSHLVIKNISICFFL
jgi:hypothetical protein